jgi:tryptophanase
MVQPDEQDFARSLYEKTIAEPYRTKVIEHLRLPARDERLAILKAASYSPVHLNSRDVFIDMITDSGSGAMSDLQWSALMRGDEAYMQSSSFRVFEAAVQKATGFAHILPTHQGRAAESIMMDILVKPGDVVLSNTHFDTTRAHVEHRDALPVDLVSDALWNFAEPQPFKGNFDLQKLELALARMHERVPFVLITVLNNFACSSPVSMANIRAVKQLADKYRKPVIFDACRFAENAYFIQQREPGYARMSCAEIALEMLSYGHACWMSAKKDAIVNIGGFIATNDTELADQCRERVVLHEGFYTYGGLARRDLEAIAVGLHEGLDDAYLGHRTRFVAYLGELLEQAGAVVSRPIGGSGVFVDVAALYPQLAPEQWPSVALCADLYSEGGIRIGAAPFSLHTVSTTTGELVERLFQFARFAVPRRVYSKAHAEYVAGIMARVVAKAPSSAGYRLVSAPKRLSHFFAKFEPLEG